MLWVLMMAFATAQAAPIFASGDTIGDLNRDGTVDIVDINLLINIMLGKTAAGTYPSGGDITGDGQVDIVDINLLINIMLGRYTPPDATPAMTLWLKDGTTSQYALADMPRIIFADDKVEVVAATTASCDYGAIAKLTYTTRSQASTVSAAGRNTPALADRRMVRVFLDTGETLDYAGSYVDSITATDREQRIYMPDTCYTTAIERIDSVWFINPTLQVTTASLDFGKVAAGDSKTLVATLVNTGDYPETYMVVADGAFTSDKNVRECVIEAGMSHDIALTFSPVEVQRYSSMLHLYSSAVDDGWLSIPIQGVGVESDSLAKDVVLPPAEHSFEVEIGADEQATGYAGYKIINTFGEFPVNVPTAAAGMRRMRRAGSDYNVFSIPGLTSQEGVQIHTFADNNYNPMLYAYSFPGGQCTVSYESTAISLLMMCPMLVTSDEAEFRNTVAAIKRLKSFPAFVADVRAIVTAATERHTAPDYSTLNMQPIVNELFSLIKDSRALTYSGVTLTDMSVTQQAATFKLHNDFKRSITAYVSRVKMSDNNLVIMERDELSRTLVDVLQDLIDETSAGYVPAPYVDDIEFLTDLKQYVRDIETIALDEYPELGQYFHFAIPYVLKSGSANFWKLVREMGDDASVFEKESDAITAQFGDYDKIMVDTYGLGLTGGKSWDNYTQQEQLRIVIALINAAYYDVYKPTLEVITGWKNTYDASEVQNNIRTDLRRTLSNTPARALMMKLLKAFWDDKKNIEKLRENIVKGDVKKIFMQMGKFVLKEMQKIPNEKVSDKNTYLGYLYLIWRNMYAGLGGDIGKAGFSANFKNAAGSILKEVSFATKFIDACENTIDFVGALQAFKDSHLMETHIIDKSDRAYIVVTQPDYEPLTLNQTVHFEWETYKANTMAHYYYDLEFILESPGSLTRTVAVRDIDGTACDYDLSRLSAAGDVRRVFFRIIAHHQLYPGVIYAESDIVTLMDRFAAIPMEYVDLGLPSGTLWSPLNLGATQSYDYGNYYAWGETRSSTDGKQEFTWANYAHAKGASNRLTKYCTRAAYGNNGFTDGLTQLQAGDDPVAMLYGYSYGIPTRAEWEELMTQCTWTRLNGAALVCGPNGSIIMLPMAGYRQGGTSYDATTEGSYWSSTLDEASPDDAWLLNVTYGKQPRFYDYYRSCGRSVRPVMRPTVMPPAGAASHGD